jgi:hypothetical protein
MDRTDQAPEPPGEYMMKEFAFNIGSYISSRPAKYNELTVTIDDI